MVLSLFREVFLVGGSSLNTAGLFLGPLWLIRLGGFAFPAIPGRLIEREVYEMVLCRMVKYI